MRFHDYGEPGNGFKVRLLLSQLETHHKRIELNILKSETRTPGFSALNPNGRIPILVLDEHANELPGPRELGEAALDVMEAPLTQNNYFVVEGYSIAEIALYASSHVAEERN